MANARSLSTVRGVVKRDPILRAIRVTVRDRDTMEQIRVPIAQVKDLLVHKLSAS